MAFGAVVQSKEASGASGAASCTFDAGATAGNLIVATVSRSATHTAGGAWGTPTGFTDLPQSPVATGNMGAAGFAKIAAGGETAISLTGTSENGNWRMCLVEYEGPFLSVTPNKTAEDETHLSSASTSQSSGTTATTTTADALAVAYFGADSAVNVDASRVYSNSFTESIFGSATSNTARAGVAIAAKVLSATGAIECTFSVTDTGDEMYGAIAIFSKAVNAYTLAMAQGSYTYTGQAVGLKWAHVIAMVQGAYTLTGQAVGILHAYIVALVQGAYVLTGQSVGFLTARIVALLQGAYILTGQGVDLVFSGGGVTPAQPTFPIPDNLEYSRLPISEEDAELLAIGYLLTDDYSA